MRINMIFVIIIIIVIIIINDVDHPDEQIVKIIRMGRHVPKRTAG